MVFFLRGLRFFFFIPREKSFQTLDVRGAALEIERSFASFVKNPVPVIVSFSRRTHLQR